MEMKGYHCMNPEENPIPGWLKKKNPPQMPPPQNLVEQFKANPDSFFPEFVKKSEKSRRP